MLEMAAPKPILKKATKVRRQTSEPITKVTEVPVVVPPPLTPQPPPANDPSETRHDIFKNLATDTARRIVKDLDLDQKLRYFSRFGSKDKKSSLSDDFVK